MEIKIDKSFQKDTRKITDKTILSRIATVIVNAQKARSIGEIKNLRKLKGTSGMYRIKMGDYRLGIIVSESSIEFIR